MSEEKKETEIQDYYEEKYTDNKKPCGAKDFSLVAQIVGAFWIGGWSGAKFVREFSLNIKVDVMDILISGLAIAGCFAPVYVSIVLDKIKEIKNLKSGDSK